MAIPANRAIGTTVFSPGTIANPTALATTAPAGRVSGDLILCITFCRSITATVATPSGWNLVAGFPKRSGTASGGSIYVFSRIATATSADNCTPSWSGVTTGSSGDSSGATIVAWSVLTETLDGTIQVSDLAAQTVSSTLPAFTTGTNNSMVIGLAMKIDDVAGGGSTITNFTLLVDISTASGTGHFEVIANKALTGLSSAGSSSTASVSWGDTGSGRALMVSLGFKSVMPTGAAARSETLSFVAAGVRKALGAAARAETLTLLASGVRKTFGAAARAETLAFLAAGVRKTFGAAPRAEVLTLTAAGVRKTFGAAARAETITFLAAGVRKTFGSVAQAETLTLTAAGVRKTFGSATRAETLTFTAVGVRTVYGAATLTITDTNTASGTRTAIGAAVLDLDLSLTATGHRTIFGSATLPLQLALHGAGVRTTFGTASLAETLALMAAGQVALSGSATLPLTLTFTSAGMVQHLHPFPPGAIGSLTHSDVGGFARSRDGRLAEARRG